MNIIYNFAIDKNYIVLRHHFEKHKCFLQLLITFVLKSDLRIRKI